MLIHLLLPAVYAAIFFWSFPSLISFAFFVGGVFLGFSLLVFDRLLDVFWMHPETDLSKAVHHEWQQRHYVRAIQMIFQYREHQEKLTTRSAVFLLAYILTAIFVVTSTGSALGMGVILGMGLHYCFDFWRMRKDPEVFHKKFLWQVKRTFTEKEIQQLVWAFTAFFVFLSIYVLI